MGGHISKKSRYDIVYSAVRISKIKFWVGYKFFLNGYKKNLPLEKKEVLVPQDFIDGMCLQVY